MNWTNIWLNLLGTAEWLGIDMGFWISMLASAIVVAGMNLVFWGMKPLTVFAVAETAPNTDMRNRR